jgi:hypothetical protein
MVGPEICYFRNRKTIITVISRRNLCVWYIMYRTCGNPTGITRAKGPNINFTALLSSLYYGNIIRMTLVLAYG